MPLLSFLVSLFGGGCKPSATPPKEPPSGENPMPQLRAMMLATKPAEAGLTPNDRFPKAFGVVMDMPVSLGHTATVVSMNDGHASLYTTSTFGILGGIGHERVRAAATDFVTVAQPFFDAARKTSNYPLPDSAHVRFYLLGYDGVRVLETDLASLKENQGDCLPMWNAGQRVLSELRLTMQNK